MNTMKQVMVVLAGAVFAAACAATEESAAVIGDACRGACDKSMQCVVEDADTDSAHCEVKTVVTTTTDGTAASGGTTTTVVNPAPATVTVTPGSGQVTVTPPTQPTCGGSTSGNCPSGQRCQLSGLVYSCVSGGQDWTSASFSRSSWNVVTATFTGLTPRNWRVRAGTEQEPSALPVYLLPVGGSGSYTWNVNGISVPSAAGRCAVSGSSATCQITVVSDEPFTWQGCDRDPTVANQGCSWLGWFKVERFQVITGATVNRDWNFVVQ